MDASSPPNEDQYRVPRLAHASRMRELGVDPFGSLFNPTHSIAAARLLAAKLSAAEGLTQPKGETVSIAGRIGNIRVSGSKLVFATLYDRSRGDLYLEQMRADVQNIDDADIKKTRGIQLFFEFTSLGAVWEIVKTLDLADWIGVTGRVGRSKRGEISVFVDSLSVLGKSLRPPPHQAGADSGMLAPEIRCRQRYLDLMQSDASLSTFLLRSRLIAAIRRFFDERDFIEVETPMMQPIAGGASARPFSTYHNALGIDLFLRIAPELYLKRLIVGGMERVYELNRNFRNEGLSLRHNPEFTMIEWYQAYADHRAMMDLSETLIRFLADKVLGTRVLQYANHRIDLGSPWRRISYRNALEEFGNLRYDDHDAVNDRAQQLGLDPGAFTNRERLTNEVWERVVEPHLIQPTFITDQPTWLTPLCKTHPNDPSLTQRFELFMAGMELGNAYSELNDPDLQRTRFAEQLAEAALNHEEGMERGAMDDDYCTALDHGLPACGGQGVGIDRLVMLFSGRQSIRDVILFPAMKPVSGNDAALGG